MILVEGDTAYDTDFAMFYTLYHIFKQESIQGRGTMKGSHLALYQIFKTTGTVFTTKYVINIYISSQNDPFYTKQSGFFKYHLRFVYLYWKYTNHSFRNGCGYKLHQLY